MKILLVKPCPDALQFGLAPFFQTEPLGLEYISTALQEKGHTTAILDMRFHRRSFSAALAAHRPDVVGIACLHILDAPATLRLADEIKALRPNVFVVVGGHAASAYPEALNGSQSIDAICIGEGEMLMPAVCDALEQRRALEKIPALEIRSGRGGLYKTGPNPELPDLRKVSPPDRSKVAAYRKNYCCLNYMPVWALETTRGCPHRCKFCSVWQFYRGSCRFHKPESVRADFENTGQNVFIIDDIFWADRDRSEELARMLSYSGIRKNWILVQSRADIVAANSELLKVWRPLARKFDIFFGFESATEVGLDSLNKRAGISATVEAIETARKLDYGVTGNFIIDPNYSESDFAALWKFIDAHQLHRVGFTILTPLPGTFFFDQVKGSIRDFDWKHYDLHHLLWPPRLPVERFFGLYCETWRRSVLNLGGMKKWWGWLREVNPLMIPRLVRILLRTQKLMDPEAYLKEIRPFDSARPAADCDSLVQIENREFIE